MAGYSIKSSYPTVQVLTPSLVQDIQYCTIQTDPSNVIASLPIDADTFASNEGGRELTAFAAAIETIMGEQNVIAGIGSQKIDDNGLLADYVDFTVQYVPTGSTGSSVTGIASVPVTLLDFSDPNFEHLLREQVDAIINGVYANLQNIAGG